MSYNLDRLYRSYALVNNILLQLEGETDLGEFSVRPSIPTIKSIKEDAVTRQSDYNKLISGLQDNPDSAEIRATQQDMDSYISNRIEHEIRKFRGDRAWNLTVTSSDNPRRFPCYTKMEIVRNFIQCWFDNIRFENGIVTKDGAVRSNWQIYTRAFLKGQYKQCRAFINDFLAMAAEIVYRLDQLDPPDQQTPTPQTRHSTHKLGFAR